MNNQNLIEIAVQLLPACRDHLHNTESGMRALGVSPENLEQRAAKLAIKQAKELLKAYADMNGGNDE
nr:hypothetical protein [uncultured Acinetobacter sp.]